jgi:Ca2+:H+ antiporter
MAATRSPWWARTWPVLAWVVLITAAAVLGTGGLVAAIAGIVLIATVFAAVDHAEI